VPTNERRYPGRWWIETIISKSLRQLTLTNRLSTATTSTGEPWPLVTIESKKLLQMENQKAKKDQLEQQRLAGWQEHLQGGLQDPRARQGNVPVMPFLSTVDGADMPWQRAEAFLIQMLEQPAHTQGWSPRATRQGLASH
jgi:hypothetical protein